MKIKDVSMALALSIVLILIWLLIEEKEKAKRKDEIIERLRRESRRVKLAYLGLLERFLHSEGDVEPSIVEELNKLKNEIDNLDNAVHIELNSVIQQVSEGRGAKAVKDLAKIVENALKEKVIGDENFTLKPMLHNLLVHAKDTCLIDNRLFENGIKLKEIRNKESHELNVSISQLELGMSIFSGIELLYAIH